MPDFMQTPFDKRSRKPDPVAVDEPVTVTGNVVLPARAWEAMLRGARNSCPRCNGARLFFRFLKPIPHCPHCGQDWQYQQADDFPAYVSILLTGHIMAPLIIVLVRSVELSVLALIAIIIPLALILQIGMLQPAKGAVIALQWWFGMHGFKKERPALGEIEAEP